jgi:hypothetical protein
LLLFSSLLSLGQVFKPLDQIVQKAYADRYPDNSNWVSTSLIHCRDGSKYIGSNVGMNNSKMRFRLNTGDTINVSVEFIKKYYGPDDIIILTTGKYHFTSGWFTTMSNGYALDYNFSGQLNWAAGWRFNKGFAAGMGVGFESHEGEIGGISVWNDFYTTYGFGRYYLTSKKRRLYLDTKIGYGFPASNWGVDQHAGGFNFQPGIGLIVASNKWYRWYFSLSNCFQYSSGKTREFDIFSSPINTDYEIWFKRIIFTFGIEIH